MPNLVRPDGTVVNATDEEARLLQSLGYKEEERGAGQLREQEAEAQRYYTSGAQQVATAAEGFVSGATAGVSDFVIDTENAQERARFNPGTRMAGQLVGAIAPAIATGPLATLTPAGQIARGSAVLAEGAATGRIARAAIAAGAEGAVTGAGTAAGNAHLSGDPVTVESVLAGAGWGALYGAGIGAGFGALGKGAEALGKGTKAADGTVPGTLGDSIADRIALRNTDGLDDALDSIAAKPDNYRVLDNEGFTPLRNSVTEIRKFADDAVRQVDDAMVKSKKYVKEAETAAKADADNLASLTKLKQVQDDILDAAGPTGTGGKFTPEGSEVSKSVMRAYKAASRAAEEANPVAMQKAFDDYRTALRQANKVFGFTEFPVPTVGRPNPMAFAGAQAADEAARAAVKSLEDVTALRASAKALKDFPTSPESFLHMRGPTAERMFASLDNAFKSGGEEIAVLRDAFGKMADDMAQRLGLVPQGTDPVAKLKEVWNAAKSASAPKTQSQVKNFLEGDYTSPSSIKITRPKEKPTSKLGYLASILQMASARKASSMARAAGGGAFASSAAYQAARRAVGGALGYGAGGLSGLIAEVTGMRAAVHQGMKSAVASYGPKVSRAGKRLAPQVGAMSIRLGGDQDDEKGSRKELFARRSKEIREALPAARNTLMRSVSPLIDEGENDFASALHEAASTMLEGLASMLPKDPGDQFSRGKSLWTPSDVEILQFERKYEVFQDPLEVVTRSLSTGDITPEAAGALKTFYPALYDELRFEMMGRLASDEKFTNSLSYNDQVNLSVLLELDLHASLRPDWIASQQTMFMEQVVPPDGAPGVNPAGNNGGRPAGGSKSAYGPYGPTKSQQLTER
jgi:hypothetical protein